MKIIIFTFLFATIVCSAEELEDQLPLNIPAEAKPADSSMISFPLAHKAKKANLLFKKVADDSNGDVPQIVKTQLRLIV